MLERFDLWLGKTLFIPPIIKLCHLTRQSQFAISRLFWFMAMLSGLYRADSVLDYLFFGLGSLLMMLTASLRADSPTNSMLWFRMLALAGLVLKVMTAAGRGDWAGIEYWIFILIAEYAATIRTLPPRETKSEKSRAPQRGTAPR